MRHLWALLLIALAASAYAANGTKAKQYDGATTSRTASGTNYEVYVYYGWFGTYGMFFTYTLGGSAVTLVSYIHFNFASYAATPANFCASGTPQFYINLRSGLAPTSQLHTVDVPTANWASSSITWSNQPSMAANQGTATSVMTAGGSAWYYMSITANMVNNAVRVNNRAPFRFYTSGTSTSSTKWETWATYSGSYTPYIAFDYATCVANQSCVNGACVCNAGYYLSGTTCLSSACAAYPLGTGTVTFPASASSATPVAGTCKALYYGTPTAVCTNTVWSPINNNCQMYICVAETSGGASWGQTNAAVAATGTCLNGYRIGTGTPTRTCGNTGTWGAITNPCVQNVCPAQTIGSASFGATNSLVTATGTCATGFYGSPQATCQAAGTWGTVSPTCTQYQCTATTDAPNHVSWPLTFSLATATGTCDAGWTGSPTRPCSSTGTWGAASGACTQITCAAVTNYQNANFGTTNAGTTATGTCATGYSGAPTRVCDITGTWAAAISPACVRNTCPAATYQNAQWPANTQSLTNAQGTCSPGWTGSPTRACQADGSWGTTVTNPCTQILCPATQLDNANWPQIAAGTSSVSGTCVSGYSGPTTRACDITGSWAPVTATCTRNQCPALTNNNNANWPLTNSLTSASGTCVAGWSGAPTRTCGADGTWGSITNPCVQLFCPADYINRASFASTAAGSNAVVTCDQGWQNPPTRACKLDGTWNTVSGACTQIMCAAANDSSAQAVWSTTAAGSTSIAGSCYTNSVGFPVRDCFFNGTWSGTTNACITNPCVAIAGENGMNFGSPTVVNTVVTGSCMNGYSSPTVNPQRLCQSDGMWSSTITGACTRNQCAALNEDNAAWTQTSSLTDASGTCNQGWSGAPTRSCSAAGVFGPISSPCVQLFCTSSTVDHSSWSTTAAGVSNVAGSCDLGWAGSTSRSCDWNGVWGDITGTCVQLKCPYVNDSDAQAIWQETNSGSSLVTGNCYPNTNGNPTRTCGFDGVWEDTSNGCSTNPCPTLNNNNHANWIMPASADVVVTGTCVAGWTAGTVAPTRMCNADGSWSEAIDNPCVQNVCSAKTEGNAEWPSAVSFGTSHGTCAPGWSGAPTRTCQADGTFSAIVAPCIQIFCNSRYLQRGTWERTAAGTNAVHGVCDQGWAGTPTANCAFDGTWEAIENPCTQLLCPAFNDSSAQAIWPEAYAGDVWLAGVCYHNSRGSPIRNCKWDGTWDAPTEPCITNPCSAVTEKFTNWPAPAAVSTVVTGTCFAGYTSGAGPTTRLCQSDGFWATDVTNPCTAIMCTTQTAGYLPFNAQWQSTQAGFTTTGTCLAGYRVANNGLTMRSCTITGQWTTPSPLCEQITCAATTDALANWPSTAAGSTASGVCEAGYAGSPTRTCDINGNWGAISNACVQAACLAINEGFAAWPAAPADTTVTGTCQAGYTGTVSRTCSLSGIWQTISGTCTQITCAAETSGHATYASSVAGATVQGVCETGYSVTPAPTRTCQLDGVWSAPSSSCARLQCAAATFDNANWPVADSMTNGVFGTCVTGYQGAPTRDCSANGIYGFTITNPCTHILCPAVDEGTEGFWTSANAGSIGVAGTCPDGTTGSPSRNCNLDGTWGDITGACAAIFCQQQSLNNANWPKTPAGFSASGLCDSGYAGSPARPCSSEGVWGAVENPCVQLTCASLIDENAEWPLTNSLTAGVTGTCLPGFMGSPTRECDSEGNWGPIEDPCANRMCPPLVEQNADWPSTVAGTPAAGVCATGYSGFPTRQCDITGTWSPTVTNPCIVHYDNCPASSVGQTFFPSTAPGSTIVGTCPSGYEPSEIGPPARTCYSNGTWEETFVNPCALIPVESSGAIANLTFSSFTSTSVTLAWDGVNLTANATFRVEVATGAGVFVIANVGTAIGFEGRNFTVTGLVQYTLYNFRVTAGDDKGYSDDGGAVIAFRTAISPPGGLRLDSATTSSLTISWGASSFADFYAVYYRTVGARAVSDIESRAVSDGFLFYSNYNATQGAATVSGLSAGQSYELLVLSGKDNVTEPVGARLTITTQSSTNNIIGDGSLGTNGAIIAGASAAAVVAFIVVLIIVIIVMRRRQRVTEKQLNEFGGAEALNTLREYRQTLARSRGSMAHAESTTHLSFADKTVVNTVMEVSLPGFLQLDYTTSIQPGAMIEDMGEESAYSATLLDSHVAQRIGSKQVTVTDYAENPQFTKKENDERFHREVSLMWSLSFHPNIVALVAYTDEPRTIVTRHYSGNLYQFLHLAPGAESLLESPLLLHLASGIVSGLNAIHSMQVAHRSVSATAVNIQAPAPGELYPTAVIGRFSNARAADDTPSVVVSSESLRYAAPEVLNAQRIAGPAPTLEEDMASDAFSLGVLLWEMYERQEPWAGRNEAFVERQVIAGQFLEISEPNADDNTRVVLGSLIQSVFNVSPARRPTLPVINGRLSGLQH